MIEEGRHFTYEQIEQTLNIGAPAVYKIFHEHLTVRKLCTLWVPLLLTESQKMARVKW
jgi:hypothetical protein